MSKPTKMAGWELWQRQDRERLEKLYRALDIPYEKFAERMNMGTPGNVSAYVNGWQALNLENLFKFAEGLNVEPRQISPTLADKMSWSIEKICGQFAALYEQLEPRDREELLELARFKLSKRGEAIANLTERNRETGISLLTAVQKQEKLPSAVTKTSRKGGEAVDGRGNQEPGRGKVKKAPRKSRT